MDSEEFRVYGRQMLDYIANYLENIRERRVVHNVSPGYMKSLLPTEAPKDPEDFNTICKDIENIIMPGVTHWQHPQFHGFFAAGSSYPSILGDMLSDAFGCIGFSWAASPACTELEMITTDWLGKMFGLPKEFLHCSPGSGGGVIQGTASETVILCLLAAKTQAVAKYRKSHPDIEETEIVSKLVCYTSEQSHASAKRSALFGAVRMRSLETDDKFSLRGEILRKAIKEDTEAGKIPFFLCASLGTTGTCSFDNLQELGPICEKTEIWLHIDAAYAGSAFVCPEFRHYMKGIEYAQTVSINAHKWMLINFDLSVMWVKDSSMLVDAFKVNPVYFRHDNESRVPDYRHWQLPMGRRFRSLKVWFVLRSYGVTGIQAHIRRHVRLAKEFEQMILEDGRFEVVAEVVMGLVCFRLKGPNVLTEKLLGEILAEGRIFLTPEIIHEVYFLRFAVCAERTNSDDITLAFSILKKCTDYLLKVPKGKGNMHGSTKYGDARMDAVDTQERSLDDDQSP